MFFTKKSSLRILKTLLFFFVSTSTFLPFQWNCKTSKLSAIYTASIKKSAAQEADPSKPNDSSSTSSAATQTFPDEEHQEKHDIKLLGISSIAGLLDKNQERDMCDGNLLALCNRYSDLLKRPPKAIFFS